MTLFLPLSARSNSLLATPDAPDECLKLWAASFLRGHLRDASFALGSGLLALVLNRLNALLHRLRDRLATLQQGQMACVLI